MVETVEHVTFSGARAREQGQDVLYITERCVMRLGDKGSSPPRSCRASIRGGYRRRIGGRVQVAPTR
jgi:hypothetical protein